MGSCAWCDLLPLTDVSRPEVRADQPPVAQPPEPIGEDGRHPGSADTDGSAGHEIRRVTTPASLEGALDGFQRRGEESRPTDFPGDGVHRGPRDVRCGPEWTPTRQNSIHPRTVHVSWPRHRPAAPASTVLGVQDLAHAMSSAQWIHARRSDCEDAQRGFPVW